MDDRAESDIKVEAHPDLAAVISNIIKHGETIDNHYAAHGLNELGIVDTESFLPLGASMHLKIQSLPILDNLVSPETGLRNVRTLKQLGYTITQYFGKVDVSGDSCNCD